MRRIADQREPVGHEGARDLQVEREGLAGTRQRNLAEPQPKRLVSSSRKPASSRAMMASPRSFSSVQTIEQRLPFSGSMAKGPEGRKC